MKKCNPCPEQIEKDVKQEVSENLTPTQFAALDVAFQIKAIEKKIKVLKEEIAEEKHKINVWRKISKGLPSPNSRLLKKLTWSIVTDTRRAFFRYNSELKAKLYGINSEES